MATITRADGMTTIEEIRGFAKLEQAAFDQWMDEEQDEDSGDDLPPDGRYWEPLEAWLREYDPKVMPVASRQMKELDEAYRRFNETGRAMPEQSFWNARGSAQEACFRPEPELKPRKSVAVLMAEKVPMSGIAYEWRLLDADGRPDIKRVQQEVDQPGSVITPEYIEADNRWRLGQHGFLVTDDNPADEWRPTSVPELKPNMQSLIEERANLEQIGKVMAKAYGGSQADWIDQATHLAERLGIELPVNGQQTLNEGGRDTSEKQFGKDMVDAASRALPAMPESVINPTSEEISRQYEGETGEEQQVIELFEQGEAAGDISRTLGIPPKRVKAILRKLQAGNG